MQWCDRTREATDDRLRMYCWRLIAEITESLAPLLGDLEQS